MLNQALDETAVVKAKKWIRQAQELAVRLGELIIYLINHLLHLSFFRKPIPMRRNLWN